MLEIVDAGKGAYRVERYVIEPLPRDATVDGNINNLEMVVEAVKRGYKRLATRTKHVAMAVPSGAVITKKIIVPATLREERARDPGRIRGQSVHPVCARGGEPRLPGRRAVADHRPTSRRS